MKPFKEYTVMEKPNMSTRREQIAEGVKYFIVGAALIWIVAGSLIYAVKADQFRITNGHPECVECNGVEPEGDRPGNGSVGTFLDEGGNFFQNGDTLGRLDFIPSEEIGQQFGAIDQRFDSLGTFDSTRIDNSIARLDYGISHLNSKLSSAIAGAYALSNIPTPPNNGLNMGVAVGYYDGYSSLAVGAMGHTEKLYLKGGLTYGEYDQFGGGIGIGFSFR